MVLAGGKAACRVPLGGGSPGCMGLTPDEETTQLVIWAMVAAVAANKAKEKDIVSEKWLH